MRRLTSLLVLLWTPSALAEDSLLPKIDYTYAFYRQAVEGAKPSEWVASGVGSDSNVGTFSVYGKSLNRKTSLEAYAVRNTDEKFDATRLELRLKHRITDSLYILAGMERRTNLYEGFDHLHTWGDMGPTFAIGHHWQFKGGFSFGIDWVRAYFPLVSFENTRSRKSSVEPILCIFCITFTYSF